MAEIELTTTASIPANTSLSVTVYEDTDQDGVAENSTSQSIDDGTNTYVLSGFAGGEGNDYWLTIEPSTSDPTTTPSLTEAGIDIPTPLTATATDSEQITVSWNPEDRGIEWGYESDNLTFYANQWGGSSNEGEIDLDGDHFVARDGVTRDITPINNGIALAESGNSGYSTGQTGYIMYSEESVHSRFSDNPPNSNNCDHLIGVVHDGNGWLYDDNGNLHSFTPRETDILVAEVIWGVDDIAKLATPPGSVEGIELGIRSDNLTFYLNQWGGSSNTGELDLDGDHFVTVDGTERSITPINNGIALNEDGTSYEGYIMYSKESVHSRFSANPPNSNNCDHLIGVRHDGNGWLYDDNGNFHSFTPRDTDVLIAELIWGVEDVTKTYQDWYDLEVSINGDSFSAPSSGPDLVVDDISESFEAVYTPDIGGEFEFRVFPPGDLNDRDWWYADPVEYDPELALGEVTWTAGDWDENRDESGVAPEPTGRGDHLTQGYRKGSLTRGLLAYYPLDEGSGSTAGDSALGNDGAINGATWNGSGNIGSDSLSFDGTSDYVGLSNLFDFGDGDFSISAWVKSSALSSSRIVSNYDGSTAHFGLNGSFQTAGQVEFICRDSGSNDIRVSTGDLSDGTWHHVVGVRVGVTGYIYADGAQVDSHTNTATGSVTSGSAPNIGRSPSDAHYYTGDVDDVRVYDRALSPPEISALFELTEPSVVTPGDTLQ